MVHILIKMALNMLVVLKMENFQEKALLHGKRVSLQVKNMLENLIKVKEPDWDHTHLLMEMLTMVYGKEES